MAEPLTIYTIGHSNAPAGKIIELLQKFEIRVLADVRSTPYSRYNPQFNRETFEQTLNQAGIEYRYAGDTLGGRPKDPACYQPDGHVNYPAVMEKDFFQKGIQQLMSISLEHRTAVMCSEENPANCHRHHLIGFYLARLGVTVLHIRGDGSTVQDQLLINIKEKPPAEQPGLF